MHSHCPFAVPSRTAEILRSPAIFTRLLVVFGVTSIARWRNPLPIVKPSYLEDNLRIWPNPVSRCEASPIAVPVRNIGAIYVGYDHTARTGDACQVRSGPENCTNEYRAMQPSWCDAKPAWFASESARAYCPMHFLRLGPVSSVVADSQAR